MMLNDTAPAWDGRAAEPGDWHWLGCGDAPPFPWRWLPATADDPVDAWGNGDGRELTVAGAAKGWRYYGPCLTPSEQSAREAAAFALGGTAFIEERLLERESAAFAAGAREMQGMADDAVHDALHDLLSMDQRDEVRPDVLEAIRALPIDTTALDRLLAEAREEERAKIAADVDCGCAARPDVLARLAADGEKRASYLCQHGDVCCAIQAASIRRSTPA